MFGLESYTRTNMEALAETFIPETPELARERGKEHRPGATEVNLAKYLMSMFDNMQEIPPGTVRSILEPFGVDKIKLSPLIALLLDLGAIEFVAKTNQGSLLETFELGLFAELSTEDRMIVLNKLETDSTIKEIVERAKVILPQLGIYDFLVAGLNTFPAIGYYGEWSGYPEGSQSGVPDSETFTGEVQSWEQIKYPGPTLGYAHHRGYELEEYKENDYE